MADGIEGVEKDPRVESLYEASKVSPGLCDVREETGDYILAAVRAAVAQAVAEFRSEVFSPEWKLTANNATFARAVAAELHKSLPTCDPPDACKTHGRCWTHSENCDGTPTNREQQKSSKTWIHYTGPEPAPAAIMLHIEIPDIEKFTRLMSQNVLRAFYLKSFKTRMIRNPSGRMEAIGEVEFAPFDARDAFIRVVDDPRHGPPPETVDPQTLTPACDGYHDPSQPWGAGGDNVSLAEGIQD